MCMCVGYCRISTAKQSIERQIRNIQQAYPEATIIQEVYTGTTTDRKEWSKLYAKAAAGDTIIFDSVSRMSRDADEGFTAYEDLYNRGVRLIFLKAGTNLPACYRHAGTVFYFAASLRAARFCAAILFLCGVSSTTLRSLMLFGVTSISSSSVMNSIASSSES